MKILLSVAAALAFSSLSASAQDLSGNANRPSSSRTAGADITGFRAPSELGPSAPSSKMPNPHPNLRPRAGGVFVDGAKYGVNLINPAAPASYGMGEKYLAAPDARYDLERESGRAAHHDAGGIKLLTFEF